LRTFFRRATDDEFLLSIAQAIALNSATAGANAVLVDSTGLINNQVVTGIAQDVRYNIEEWLLNSSCRLAD